MLFVLELKSYVSSSPNFHYHFCHALEVFVLIAEFFHFFKPRLLWLERGNSFFQRELVECYYDNPLTKAQVCLLPLHPWPWQHVKSQSTIQMMQSNDLVNEIWMSHLSRAGSIENITSHQSAQLVGLQLGNWGGNAAFKMKPANSQTF